jgi:hypothetical protein
VRSEFIDGVVRPALRAVAATILYRELEISVCLLRDADVDRDCLAAAGVDLGAVGVERVGGIDQVASVGKQPIDAVGIACLLVRGECENDVAISAKSFPLKTDQRRHHDRVAVLHIRRAAPIIISILLDELEGIHVQSSRRASTTSR